MCRWWPYIQCCILTVALVPLSGGGCTITVGAFDGVSDDAPVEESGKIVVRVVNRTNVTLDPQIYVSAEPVTADELFASENKYTTFGVGTLGLLGGGGSDRFPLSCEQARVIGTQGGLFGDDLNNPDGSGRRIVLTQDYSVFCGGSVTFIYEREGDGFTTTYDVEP